jgi:Ca2+-binding EF-hand superfamily protein
MYDSGRNKKFDKDEMDKVFRSRNISIGEIEQRYLFDEYDPKGTGMIDYYDLEKDYQNFIEWF